MMQAEEQGRPAPTVAEIAIEVRGSKIGSAHTATRNDLILSKHLNNPAVAKAKTPQEAMQILKKVEQAAYHKKLAEVTGKNFTSTRHACINADSREWMRQQTAGLFDVICTDPPYGIGADTFGTAAEGTATSHGYVDSAECLVEIVRWFPAEAFRLAKPQAHLYLFCDIDWFASWKIALKNAGWKVFRTPLIWVRPTGFRTPWIDQGPQRKYECILYAVKGEKHVNLIAPDVITLQSAGEGLGHPAAKPAAIYTELLRRSVKPGDSVFDPFCGTGPVFKAATDLHCAATGVELDETFYGIALAQLQQEDKQGELL
jgi:DNA modification methylase